MRKETRIVRIFTNKDLKRIGNEGILIFEFAVMGRMGLVGIPEVQAAAEAERDGEKDLKAFDRKIKR